MLMYTFTPAARRSAIDDIARLALSDQPHFAIAHHFALDQVVQAHRTVEAGTKLGHVLPTIDTD
jgi:hypothetical protein